MPDDSFAPPFRVFTRSSQQIVDTTISPPHFKDAFLWSNNVLLGRESPQFVSPVGFGFRIPSLNATDPLLGPQVEGAALFYPLTDEESIPFSQAGLDLSQNNDYLAVCTLFPHCINSPANIHIRRLSVDSLLLCPIGSSGLGSPLTSTLVGIDPRHSEAPVIRLTATYVEG
jgi:hypothetical protein